MVEKVSAPSLDDEFMTTADVSKAIRVPTGTLRWWRNAGVGPKSFKIVGSVRYRRADVDRWLKEQYEMQVGS